MADKPRLPPVSTLLQLTDLDSNYSSRHRSHQRPHRSFNNFDGSHLSASFSHHRGRSSSPLDSELESSGGRPYKQQHSSRSHHSAKNSSHGHKSASLLPSVSEMLASDSAHTGNWTSVNSEQSSRGPSAAARHADMPSRAMSVPSSRQSGHPCERCGRMFTRKSDAVKHKRVVHDKVKTYVCRECGRKFARKDYCTVSYTFLFALSRKS